MHTVTKEEVLAAYPKSKPDASKFDFGRVLSVCGSRGMTGAAILGGMAALRSGCGLMTVAIPKSEQPIVASAMPELMTFPLPETATGSPATSAFEALQTQLEKADVLLIGSGLTDEPETSQLLLKILREIQKPIIADAGAVIALKNELGMLKARIAPTILTPHVGELAVMLGLEWKQVASEREEIARNFAIEYRVALCMKGHPTYVISAGGEVFENSTGGVGLATAGSGDVLAGMIAGTLAQMPEDPVTATWIAVYLHGLAGDFAQQEMTTIGMTASDIIRHLPDAYHTVGLA